jgi:hypothetical protein
MAKCYSADEALSKERRHPVVRSALVFRKVAAERSLSLFLLLPSLALLIAGLWWQGAALAGTLPDYLAEIRMISASPDFFAGKETRLAVEVTNRGRLTWPSSDSDPAHPVNVSYHWTDPAGRIAIFDGLRTGLPHDLKAGEKLVMRVAVLSPPEPGSYTLALDMVREGVTWFAQQGSPSLTISPVTAWRAGTITWQRSRILIIAGAALVLLFVMGLGAARLFAPDFPRPLTPLAGAAVIIALGYYGSLLGIPMRSAWWGILAVGVGAAALSMIARRVSWRPRWRQSAILVVLTLAMLTLTLWPMWAFGRPTTVQNLYASYFVVMSEYWKNHALRDVPGLDPHQPLDYLVRDRLVHRYVTGTPFLNAFITSGLGLDSYETYSILTAILLALLPPALYWVARSAFGLSPGASGLAALLCLANVTYLLWSLRGQITFVAGMLFLPLAIGAGALLLEGRGSLLLAALFLSTLLAVYPPLVPYALVVLLLHGGLLLWWRNVSLRALAVVGLKLLGSLVLVNPVIVFNEVVSGLSTASQISENWHNIPGYPSLAELLGLYPHFSPDGGASPLSVLSSGLVPIVLAIVGYGLYRAWKGRRALLVTAVVPYAAGFLVIYFLMDYSYGYYKHGVVTLFAFLFALASGLEALWKSGRIWKWSALLCGGAFFLLNLLALQVTYTTALPRFVPPDLASVGGVKRLVKEGEVLLVDQGDVALQVWTSYFLWGVPLSVPPAFEPWGWWGFSSVSGRGDPLRFYHPRANYTLTRWGEIIRQTSLPIWDHGAYVLYAGFPVLSLGTGWHDLEEGPAAFRWMGAEGTLNLGGEGLRDGTVRLRLVLQAIVAPLTIEVLVGGEQVGAFRAQQTSHPVAFVTRAFPVYGRTTITVRSIEGCFEPASLVGSLDHRCLSVSVRELRILDG